jgi:serine/threonine protein phosphatase 1
MVRPVMFKRLFGSAPGRATVPAGSRVYAIGDIHGRADLLREMHELIRADAKEFPSDRRVVVYLGDYVDRGDESRQVIDLLLDEKLAGFESVYLLGNHERTLLDFLRDISVAPSWFLYGGVETLASYGVRLDRRMPSEAACYTQAQLELRRTLPPRQLAFLHALKLTHVEGDYLFAHAGIRPGVALDAQAERDVIWIRDEFLDSTVNHGKIVVHGHTITDAPETRANRIGIDTGAFASGKLTCLVLQDDWRGFMSTSRSSWRR